MAMLALMPRSFAIWEVECCSRDDLSSSLTIRAGRIRNGRIRRGRLLKARDGEGEEGYWDNENGKKKREEIEFMRQLISEAGRMKDEAQLSGEENEAKLQEELVQRAKELAEERKKAQEMFEMGKRAYGRGAYDKSVAFFEAALSSYTSSSDLGGQIQLWLALAYEANNQHEECIELYKSVEKFHPSRDVKRRAAELRYILEAPKLKIMEEESVSIPVLSPYYERSDKRWSDIVKERVMKKKKKNENENEKSKTKEDWVGWNPPQWEKSPSFWLAVTLWLTLAGISLMFQN